MRARSSSRTTRARHKKIIKLAKGYRWKRGNVFARAQTAVMRAGRHSYIGRRLKKRAYRGLWITRLNAACRENGINYSRFADALLKARVLIDRKVLAELAVNYEPVFKALLASVVKK